MDITDNIILNTDSYKTSQWVQYPPNTEALYAYIEARGGEYKQTVFYGMWMYLSEYLSKPITMEMIDFADVFLTEHGEPFNREGWLYILEEYNGYIPVRIKAVPEGTVISTSNALVTVESTDERCAWLTTYIEQSLLRGIWYPTTVATKSRSIKKLIKHFMEDTAPPSALEGLDFKLHDFGGRGVSSLESAGIGGSAHLSIFKGTDTMAGILWAMKYYDADVCGFSVPAAEHSTITAWGKPNEVEAYRNIIKQFGGKYPIISIVADTNDVFNATENIFGGELREMVETSGSMLVVRPDSGDPAEIVGKIAQILDKKFGSTVNIVNGTPYKLLNNVRILQGDGLSELNDFAMVLERLRSLGFSADNITFGMGGGLLQKVDRDTCKFAMKVSNVVIDGESIDVRKDPITDVGKRSKLGRFGVVADGNGDFRTISEAEAGIDSILKTVYYNGELFGKPTFDEIRERAAL